MEHLDRYQKILDFLSGKLPPAEAQAFQAEIDRDEKLAEQVAFQRLEQEMMDTMLDDHLDAKMAVWEQDLASYPPPPPHRRRGNWWWLALFAVAVAVAVWQWSSSPTIPSKEPAPEQERIKAPSNQTSPNEEKKEVPDQAPKSSWPEPPKPVDPPAQKPAPRQQLIAWAGEMDPEPHFLTTQRRSQGNLFAEASAALDAGHTQEAIRLFEQLTEDADLAAVAHNNLGYLYFGQQDFDAALPHFEILAKNTDFDFPDEARWMRVLCLLGSGQVDTLRPALAELTSDPIFRFQAEAKALQARLAGLYF